MFRIVLVLLLTTMLSACSTRLAYNYADWWIEWQVEELVDLNSEQEELVSRVIDDFFIWHRENELPEYARLLDQFRTAVNQQNVELFELSYQQTFDVWQRSAQFIAPRLIAVIATLDDNQKQQLVENIKLKQNEQHQQWLEQINEPDYKSERLEQRLDALEQRLGYLTDSQKQSYSDVLLQIQSTLQDRINSRISWLAAFERAILSGPQQTASNEQFENKQQELLSLLVDINAQRSEQHQQKNAFNRGLYKDWFLQQVNQLEGKQRAHLFEEINDYLSDIQYLARQ